MDTQLFKIWPFASFWILFVFIGTLVTVDNLKMLSDSGNKLGKRRMPFYDIRKKGWWPSENSVTLWTEKSQCLVQDSNPARSDREPLLYSLHHHHGHNISLNYLPLKKIAFEQHEKVLTKPCNASNAITALPVWSSYINLFSVPIVSSVATKSRFPRRWTGPPLISTLMPICS